MSLPKQLLESKIITDEQWKEYQELKEVAEEYKQISITHYNRPYAKRYLKEAKKRYKKETGRNLLYSDSEEIYKNYYKQKEEIERLKKREQECIDHYLVQCKYASEIEGKYISANYIINELEKEIKWQRKICLSLNNYGVSVCDKLLNKLQELKGSNKQ